MKGKISSDNNYKIVKYCPIRHAHVVFIIIIDLQFICILFNHN